MKTLKFLLKSLFSNGTIIKEGRKQKWWLTFLILVLSIAISLIPTLVTILNTNGSAIINNGQTQNIDYALERLSFEYLNGNEAKVVLKIVDNKMVMEENKTFSDVEEHKELTIKGNEKVAYVEIGRDNEPILLVTYVKFSIQENAAYNNIGEKVSDVKNQLYISHKTADKEDDEGYSTSRLINTLIFAEDGFYFFAYENNSTTKYKLNADGTLSFKNTAQENGLVGTYGNIASKNANLTTFANSTSPTQTVERWKSFFDQAYKPQKTATLITSLLIYASLNVVIVLVMSLTIVIMSRFKSAQCGKIGFGGALKLVSFATLCPSILGMLLGFIIPKLQAISFLMFVGFRCIFLSTRLTRGEATEAPSKPANAKPAKK